MKKVVSSIACCLIVTSLLISCGGSKEADSGEANGKVELRFLAPADEGRANIYNELFAKFEEETGIKVTPEYVTNWDDFNQKYMTQLAAKSSPDVVDVSVIYKDQFIDSGYFYDISTYAKERNFDFSKYYESHFEGFSRGDALYGMPNGTTMIAVYYNKALFDEAGIPYPDSDWTKAPTWDEFFEIVGKLTKGEGPNKQYGLGTTIDIAWLFPLLWQNGADFVTPDGTKSAINTPEGIESLQYIYDLFFESGYSPSLSTLKTIQVSELFKTGKVAMFMDGNWWMESLSSIDSFEWGVMPLPQNKDVITGSYIDCWSVSADSKYPYESYQLTEYLISEEGLRMHSAKGIPSMIQIAEDEIDVIYSFVDEESRRAWSGALAAGRTPVYTKNWAQIIAEANKSLEKLALGEISAADAAAEIEKSTNMLLK